MDVHMIESSRYDVPRYALAVDVEHNRPLLVYYSVIYGKIS